MEKKIEIISTEAARKLSFIYDDKKLADEARVLLNSIGNVVSVDEDAQSKFIKSLDHGIESLMDSANSIDKKQLFDTVIINNPNLESVIMRFYLSNVCNYLHSSNGLIVFDSRYIEKLKDKIICYFPGSLETDENIKYLVEILTKFDDFNDKESYSLIYYY